MIEFLKTAFNTRKRLLIAALWLFAISFLVSNFFSYRTSLGRARNEVESQLQDSQERFHSLLRDTALLFALHEGNYEAGDPPPVYNEPFAFFLYSLNDIGNPILSFWNSHVVEPLGEDVSGADGSRLVKYQNGYFVIEKHTLNNKGNRLIVMALFPVKWDYFLENRYLRSDFVALKGAGKLYDISTSTSRNVVQDLHGKPLFSLVNTENKSVHRYDNFSIVLWVLGTVLLFFYLNGVAANIQNEEGLLKATGFLAAVTLIYRLLTIYIPFPFDFKKLELFDSSIYASSEMLPSLGDLMMNSLLLFWLVAFIKSHFLKRSSLSFRVSEKQSWIINGVVSAILVLAGYLLADIVQSLVEDSQISFDVMDFFSMNIYTVTSFFVLTLLLLTFYHATHILLHLVSLLPAIDNSYRLLLTGVIGLVVLVVSPFNTANSVNVIVLGWLILYLYILQQRRHDWSRPLIRSSMFIFWIMFFSFSVTAILIYQNQRTEKAARKSTAEKLAIQTDPSGENLMSIAITNLDDEWLTQNFDRFRFEQPNDFLKDSLITENFAGYLNKFDTRIYTYDSVFNQLHNDDSTTSYAKLKSLMVTYGTPTNTPGLVYYENTPDKFSYIYEKQVKGVNGNTAGYIFIIAQPKRYKSEALYPELFNQSEGGPAELGTNYAYAVYSNGRLINSYNDFNFARELSPKQYPMLEMEWRTNNERSELWYKASSTKLVVVVKKNSTSIEAVTLFAYFFFTFLFIVLLFHAGRYLVASNFNWRRIWAAASLS
ncbi:MAG TPA: hypothetical protein VF145_08065, partial [Chitinophagaceae bacterium]